MLTALWLKLVDFEHFNTQSLFSVVDSLITLKLSSLLTLSKLRICELLWHSKYTDNENRNSCVPDWTVTYRKKLVGRGQQRKKFVSHVSIGTPTLLSKSDLFVNQLPLQLFIFFIKA